MLPRHRGALLTVPRLCAFLMLAGIAIAALPVLRRRPDASPPPGLSEAELALWRMPSPSKAVH